jgi:hypothetical protein
MPVYAHDCMGTDCNLCVGFIPQKEVSGALMFSPSDSLTCTESLGFRDSIHCLRSILLALQRQQEFL